jgi:hypothetical protein
MFSATDNVIPYPRADAIGVTFSGSSSIFSFGSFFTAFSGAGFSADFPACAIYLRVAGGIAALEDSTSRAYFRAAIS